MNWLIIISITLLIAIIAAPIMWLLHKAANNGEGNGSSVERIRLIKELEMIESIYDKQTKS